MKDHIAGFCRRGLTACGLGPLVLAALYLILGQRGVIETLTVAEVTRGIFSLAALAFIAGGMNVLYQIERLPLLSAILIHMTALYLSYLLTYLINGWLEQGSVPILVFSAIFLLGFVAIWAVIYLIIRRNTRRLNEKLLHRQHTAEE